MWVASTVSAVAPSPKSQAYDVMVPSESVDAEPSAVQSSRVQETAAAACGGWFGGGPVSATRMTEKACPPPPAFTAPVTPGTVTAVERLVVVPSPSWPLAL